MVSRHPDREFDRQLRRSLDVVHRGAADADEAVTIAAGLPVGDRLGWAREWQRAADRALADGDSLLGNDDADNACRAYLRAAEY